ncbi:hypothetical protein [Pseudomonas sp. PS01300]|uniref:hypothetical protein n=1 Tax=Pseudomonas sp. PS01300 TaxID=2991436 RepID=UPI00249A2DE1|nr:hypothetical protein [Pseudomonas sp. PS01300]
MLSTQGADQRGAAVGLLGVLVFQQHRVVAATQHAQTGWRRVDDGSTESLALGDVFKCTVGRQHHMLAIPVIERPAAAQSGQHQCNQSQQRPEGIVHKAFETDHIDAGPGLLARACHTEHQPVSVQVQAFMQHPIGLELAHQCLAGGGDQAEVIVDRPLHDAFDVVDLIQREHGRHHHRGAGP